MKPSHGWKTAAAYAAVYAAWGSTYFAIKIGVSRFSPAGMMGLRFLTAGSIMLALRRLLARGSGEPSSPGELARAAAFGCALLGGGTGFLGYAERTVPSGVCALVIGCSPMLFAAFNRLADGPRLTRHQIAGGLLGLAGVVLLAVSGSSWSGGRTPLAGLALLVIGMFCWVGSSVASKFIGLPKDNNLAAGVEMLAAGALLLAAGRLRGEFAFSDLTRLPRETALAILYLAAVGSCLGFTAYSWLLRREPANRVSSYAFVNPVVAVGLGVAWGGERFTWPIGLACAAVLGGVSLSLAGGRLTRAQLPANEAEA